jgi:hypothetical protein
MSYRYNTIDIIVGIGMCAILFGALLFFLAVNGTYQAVPLRSPTFAPSIGIEPGLTWLQPVLGQAIVDQVIFDRHADRLIAQSASEWSRATLAYHDFRSRPGGALGAVVRQAVTVPADHRARVQGVMGREIVNFTARGVRTGRLSADNPRSDYNASMIRATETRAQRLHHEFVSTWQATLGRRIVEAIQQDRKQAGAIQERLGMALVRVIQAHTETEAVRSTQQEQLGSLLLAAIRAEALPDSSSQRAAIEPVPDEGTAVSTEPVLWPEVTMGYLMVAGFFLVVIFLAGLSLAVQSREKKALDEIRRDASRWVYRLAT